MGALPTILENKNVLITGASGGLGGCIAKQFAVEGCNLYLTGRNEESLRSLAKEIGTNFDREIFYKTANLENLKDVQDLSTDVKAQFKNIDILINCAGVFIVKSVAKTTKDDFQNTFNLNVRAPFLLCQEFCQE